MKTTPTVIVLLLAVGLNSQNPITAQNIPSPASAPTVDPPTTAQEYSVIERGIHHRVWQYTTLQTNALGKALHTTNLYTEMETGMHRQGADGEWIECSPELRIQPDGGALANNVQNPLYVPGSLYSDALGCMTSDGKVLTSRPLGLSFFDGGTNIFIAELRDGPIGQLLPSGSQVLYTNICT